MRTLRRPLTPAALAIAAALFASAAGANDRDLLYEKHSAAPDILILVANTESMATCIPGATLPNGQTCATLATGLGATLAPFGIGDSPYSKMGQAKGAILNIIEANASSFYFGLSSESYTRQTVRTGTTKHYTFVAKEASFCDGSSGGSFWACQPAGTAIDFGAKIGTPTTSTFSGVSYEVIPIGGVTSSYSLTSNVGAESWVQSYTGDANHQPYLLDSTHGMLITNPTGATATGNPGTPSKQEMWITYSSTTSTSSPLNPYRIKQCSTDCTFTDSGFDGQKITVTKKIVECGGSTGQVTGVTVTNGGSGYTSAPTVGFSGGSGSGAAATATISSGVSGVTITSGGSGYTSVPTVGFSGGGGGSGAAGTVNLGGAGPIQNSVIVTNGGSGYTSAPTVSFGGGGSGATATATLAGSVSDNIAVSNGGGSYSSSPTCTLVGGGYTTQATCSVTKVTGGKIKTIVVLTAGAGYTSVPTVQITDSTGSGVIVTGPTLSESVVSVTVTSGGSGYTNPTVSFSGGGGSGATATATASGGTVVSVTITSSGSGYTSTPTASFSGGGGSGAAGTPVLSGSVVSVNVTNGGSGYTSNPTVTFTGGGGSGAAGTATASVGSGSYPCDPTTATLKGTQTVDFVVPPLTGTNSSIANLLTYCSEDSTSCTYPMVFSSFDHSTNGTSGEEMGWLNYGDLDVSGNQSGWINHSRNNPQPLVMIPHAYTPWKAYSGATPISGTINYTQSSNPCIQRSFRPLSAIIDNTTTFTQNDAYPIFTPVTGQTDGSTNLSSSECDKMVDGQWQTGEFPNGGTNEIAPIVFPAGHNGSGLDLVKMLTDTYFYFNGGNNACSAAGGGVDGFCGGTRPDDPFKSCRLSAVILITDSFTGSSPDFKFGNGSDPTAQLKAIGVPVFVIGFAMAPNSNGTCSGSLPDGTSSLNVGQCIAYYSGATTYQGTAVTRQGYYNVTSAASLGTALQAALNSLNTATRDFATATIPSVSATSAGIAYLSQFNPKNNRSIWEGHLRSYFLDPTSGLVQAAGNPAKPDPTKFTFWTGATPASGSLIWDAGGSGSDTPGISGNLDAEKNIDPTLLLTTTPGASGTWSSTNDQATGVVGRNVFFGLKPGDTGCTSTTYECLTQIPVGSGGNSPTPTNQTEPSGGWTVPSPPSTLPTWWTNVQGTSYVNIPASPLEGSGNASQALQNSFSFLRGNRDPVVEAFKVATSKFDATHTTCTSLASDTDSPCYNGDVLGDLFHSNPSIVSAPSNFRYYFSNDPTAAAPGMYADRGASYQTFYSDHAHRRKILYVGGDDAALHAFDVGVYNGDQTTYDPGTGSICPLCNKFDFGSGREIFAYVPRAGLNKIYNLSHTITYNWTIDGPPTIDDVYMDATRVGGSAQGVAPSGSTADSDVTGAAPLSTSHSWRTVLVGTEREGGLTGSPDGGGITTGVSGNGGSIFALDITDPDKAAEMKTSDTGGHVGVPECIVSDYNPASPVSGIPASGCTAPYPRILWEIRDDQSTTTTAPVPTELSTAAAATTQDLGMTWSQPVTGKVKINVTSSSQPRDFFVAIFGGGYDHTAASLAATNASGNTGNFLYMVDIETGKIIYKKNLGLWSSGASSTSTAGNLTAGVPGSPGVVDINNDGYLDYVYIGDTQGRLWKVDLTASATIDSTTRVQSTDWNPVLFFDEYLNTTAQGTNARQPIFDRPALFFAGNTSAGQPQVGIAFGTGDRDNMPVSTDTNANFFVVAVDPPARAQAVSNDHPLTFADLTVASLTANNCTSTTCLGANGYYLTLPVGSSAAQIVNTDPLVFNQQIFFNTFEHTTVAGNCNEIGTPFVYILNYSTGESAQTDGNGNIVANTSGPSGAEVLSNDIIYSAGGGANATATNTTDGGAKVNVTSSADSTAQDPIKTGLTPTVKIKSWKEE